MPAFLARAAALSLACLALAACNREPEKPDPELVLAARQAALQLDMTIRRDILARLDRDEDPVAVYMAYRDSVPELTRAAAEASGLDLSRVALRVRNPTNAADDWEFEQLEELAFLANEAGLDPETLEVSVIVEEEVDGRPRRVFRWLRPLVAGETCMVCHGDEIAPRLLTLIAQDYPLDEATGYYDLELLGAWSVRKVLDD